MRTHPKLMLKSSQKKIYHQEPILVAPAKILTYMASKKLEPKDLAVFMALNFYASEDGYSRPSLIMLGKRVNINARTVSRSLVKLEKYNIIKVIRAKKKDGTWMNNIYIINCHSTWQDGLIEDEIMPELDEDVKSQGNKNAQVGVLASSANPDTALYEDSQKNKNSSAQNDQVTESRDVHASHKTNLRIDNIYNIATSEQSAEIEEGCRQSPHPSGGGRPAGPHPLPDHPPEPSSLTSLLEPQLPLDKQVKKFQASPMLISRMVEALEAYAGHGLDGTKESNRFHAFMLLKHKMLKEWVDGAYWKSVSDVPRLPTEDELFNGFKQILTYGNPWYADKVNDFGYFYRNYHKIKAND